MIEVVEVRSGKDLNDFIRLPFTLYANDPFYVPQLTREVKKHFSDKNPFFDHAAVRYFLARENDTIVGRVAAIINRRHIEFHHEKAGFFGFFESINKPEVARRPPRYGFRRPQKGGNGDSAGADEFLDKRGMRFSCRRDLTSLRSS